MTIGDFSRAVRMSAKALRFYRQSGILTPAPDVDTRAALQKTHLERMETKLAATREAVTSLRSMLEPSTPLIEIVHRSVPEMRVAAVSDEISLDALAGWFAERSPFCRASRRR